jgi:cell cycle related kinase
MLWLPPSSSSSKSRRRHAPPRFEQLGKIGEGAFGDVYVGTDHLTCKLVAIKEVRLTNLKRDELPKPALRELRALQQLEGHEHVLRLIDAFPRGGALALVLEYMPSDLEVIIRTRSSLLPEAHLKCYLWMLLQGLSFLHSRHILHRDLKPSNLLLSAHGTLKIGDLGSARVHSDPPLEHEYSHQVGTKWYRAPELLFGARQYGPAVDLWAVGVIMGELACLRPLFPGQNDMDQLSRVLHVLGTPTLESWPKVGELPDYHKVAFPDMPPQDLARVFPRVPRKGLGLFESLLRLNPMRRPTVEEALMDCWFLVDPWMCERGELAVVGREVPVKLRGVVGGQERMGRRKGDDEEELWEGLG